MLYIGISVDSNEHSKIDKCQGTIVAYIQGGPKQTTPNFGGHFDLLSEKVYYPFLDAVKVILFGISCNNMNDIAFILFKI